MQIGRARIQAGWRPRRGEGRRALARALAALLILLASLGGTMQRATSAGCAGPAAAGLHDGAAPANPALAIATATAGDTSAPVGIPGEAPARGASCGGSIALAIPAPAPREVPAAQQLPATRLIAMIGADSPEPPLGPPRLG